jgi:tRNA(fMet)-specific endonuclease VapC
MNYLLDTNVCIHLINGRIPSLRERFLAHDRADIGVSIITRAELFYGSAKSQTPERSRQKQLEFLNTLQSILFDNNAALAFGELRAAVQRKGTPIGAYDLLIASTALANRLILVTHNTREFKRIDGLITEDWEL